MNASNEPHGSLEFARFIGTCACFSILSPSSVTLTPSTPLISCFHTCSGSHPLVSPKGISNVATIFQLAGHLASAVKF
jgi:hypothetical protein